jgi:predicted transcriptional regulator
MPGTEYALPKECGLRKGSVYKLAESVGTQLGYSPGDDLEALIERLGGKIEYQDFWELESSATGSIKIRGANDFTIYLPSYTGQERDRFTIAHELGHYVLHYLYPRQRGNDPGPVKALRYGTGRVEWEANWFAAAFLMPEESFTKSFQTHNGDLFDVAQEFQVSSRAVLIRAQSLKLT